jgi:hypothetical protein
MSDNICAQPSDDAEILSLFRKWMAAERAADALKGRNEEDEEEDRDVPSS